jgi:DNA-directed RNA polymerase subunit RPC12/RpoP
MPKVATTGYKCAKCGHIWNKRGDREPKMCPKCKTVNWDE